MPEVDLGADLSVLGLRGFKRDMGRAQASADKTRGRFARMNKAGGAAFSALGRAARGFTGVMGSIIGSIGKVTLGLGAIGGVGIKAFGDFELQMAKVQTLLPEGVSAMDSFGDEVKRNSVRFGQSLGAVSGALFDSISAGVSGTSKQMSDFNTVLGQAAVGGFVDMKTVADGLTNVMNAYGIAIGGAREVSDDFFIANRLGKTTFEEIAASIGGIAPTAKTLGVTYKELLSTVVAMSKAGVTTSSVFTSLKQVFANILNPTERAKEIAGDLGVKLKAGAFEGGGLSQVLANLIDATRGNVDAQSALFGSVEAFNAIALLTSRKGAASFKESMDEMKAGAKATEKAYNDVAATTGFKLQQIKSALGRFAVEIGHGLVQGLGLDRIGDIPTWVEGAAVKIRSAAKSFAEGFSAAFEPLWEATGHDWDGLASTLGTAAGNIVNAFIQVAEIITSVVTSQGFKDFMFVMGSIFGGGPGGTGPGEAVGQGSALASESAKRGFIRGPAGQQTTGTADPVQLTMEAYRRAQQKAEAGQTPQVGRFLANPLLAAAALFGDKTPTTAQVDVERRALMREDQRARNRLLTSQLADVDKRIKKHQASIASSQQRIEAVRQSEKLRASEDAAKAIPGAGGLGGLQWSLAIDMVNNMAVKDKKAKGGGRFSARGRGSGRIRASSEQQYLLTEGRLVAMSDDFHFAHLFHEGQGGEAPGAAG